MKRKGVLCVGGLLLALGASKASDPMGSYLQRLATATMDGEARAVQTVKRLGGKITLNEKAPSRPIIGVDLCGCKVTDADLKELAGLQHLWILELDANKVTPAAIREFNESHPRCIILHLLPLR